jgi:hypothetical protein
MSPGQQIPDNPSVASQNLKNCDQNLSEISKNIEEYLKGKTLEKPVPTGEILYFLRFRFDCGRLHTVEVTGSNPVPPTTLFCQLQHILFD